MNVEVLETDINGLRNFIDKIGYENILQILLYNGHYTIIYDCGNIEVEE